MNHNRTLTYTYHRNLNPFNKEAARVRERLEKIIKAIELEKQVDSPLYYFVNGLQEPQKAENGVLKGKAKKPIYERIKEATELRSKEKYAEAFSLFEALAQDIPSDPYFIQQMALCTYKEQNPATIDALDKAYSFLSPISETIDPETNGLIGAIFKRRFLITGERKDIEMAINAYKKAYNLFNDYYTGENYAFCLLLKSTKVTADDEKEELRIMSKHTYREIFDMYSDSILEEEINTDYEIWMIGTLAACSLVLQKKDSYQMFESLFLCKADKMISSYLEQRAQLVALIRI